jgi:hypothetical protein
MRPDVRRLMWLQAVNILLAVIAGVVLVIGIDQGAAALMGVPSDFILGGFGAALMIGVAVVVLVFAAMAFRGMARGERYAPLFAMLGWALLWFPLELALSVLMPGSPAAQFAATAVSGLGVALSLAVLGSTKPR